MTGGDRRLGEAFERLDPHTSAPVAVAVSGGGDSLLALIAACDWAHPRGRPVLALSVDHGLQPQSWAWTASAGEAAARLGAGFRPLPWDGPKPATGLPAAARAARHRLLADAARAAGCTVIVTGHTADDDAENALLGQGRLSSWSPSPAWPEGRGLFLLRPLLDWRRAEIRQTLASAGWSWIDDPANADLASARIRARTGLAGAGLRAPSCASLRRLNHGFDVGDAGVICAPASAFDLRMLAVAAVCAGGGARLPRGTEIARLHGQLQGDARFAATLAGGRIEGRDGRLTISRETGRSGLPSETLHANACTVWDGRFEVFAERAGYGVRPLAGLVGRLEKSQQSALRRIAAPARASLPALVRPDGTITCPILAEENGVRCRGLVKGRFLSAIGAIDDEHSACDFVRMAKWAQNPYLRGLGLRGEVHESA